MSSRKKNVRRNFISGLFYQLISLFLPFISRTFLIYKLGVEYVGISSLFGAILMVLNISELGFGNAMVYHMYKPIEEENVEEINKLLNFYRTVYHIIGLVIFVFGLISAFFLDYLIEGETPVDIDIYCIYFIYLFNTVFSYIFGSYRKSLFNASQRVDYEININSLTSVIRYSLQIILLYIYSNFYIYAVVLPATQLLNNFLVYYYSNKKYPQYKCKGKLKSAKLNLIFRQVKGLFLQRVGQVIYESVDSIIVSSFLGLSVLGKYNNYCYIITALTGFLSIIYNSLRPSIGNSIVTETLKKNKQDFYKFNFAYVWIVGWMSITFFVLAQSFIEIWVNEDNMLPIGIPLLLAIYFFCAKECNMLAVYSEAAGLWYENRYTPLFATIMNLILNLFMVNYIGLYGVILSSIICTLVISDIGFMRTLFKYYFMNIHEGILYLIVQFLYILFFGVVGFVTWYLCCYVPFSGLHELLVKGIICLVFPNFIFYVIFRKSDNFKAIFTVIKH